MFYKYIIRLTIPLVIILVFQIIMQYGFKTPYNYGNIYIDLILGALAVKALMDKRFYIKLLSLIPLLLGILSFFFYALGDYAFAEYYPYYLRMQYWWYSIALIILFYLSYPLSKKVMNMMSLDASLYNGSNIERMIVNTLSVCFLMLVTIFQWIIGYILTINESPFTIFYDYGLQTYALFSGALILLYSGLRGYNAKWFKYFSYAYYPIHIIVIYGLFALIS